MEDEDFLPAPSEELRKKLLKQELAMRAKQPPHWAKTKYRKYSTMLNKKAEKEIAELQKNAKHFTGQAAKKPKPAKAKKWAGKN